MVLYLFLEVQHFRQRTNRMFGGLLYADQEVLDPVQQVVLHPDVVEVVVIKVFSFFKIGGDVE